MTFCTTTYNDNEIIGYPNELLIAKDNLPLDTDTTSHEYCCLVTRATRAGGSDKGILKHQNTYDQYDFCNEYRFGFNGKEKDDEWNGQTGSTYDFGARLYDARIGRWMAVDPLANKYPSFSPYSFVNNMPIWAIDPDGKDIFLVIKDHNQKNTELKIKNFDQIIEMLADSKEGLDMIQYYLDNPKEDLYITFSNLPDETPGVMTRVWNKDGNLANPKFCEMGIYNLIMQEEMPNDFKIVDINPSKKNYFIRLDESQYNKEQMPQLSIKEGAKVLAHEIGAHAKDKEQSKVDEEHDAWGQKELGKFNAETGSKADLINRSIDKAKGDKNAYKTTKVSMYKFKLVKNEN